MNLSRPVALGAPVTDAYLSFDYTINDTLEAGDTLAVQVSTNGAGGPWNTLQTMVGTGLSASGSRSFDLGAYLNANTQIRFAVTGFTDGAEYLEIDNVKIRYTTTTGGTPVASSYRDFLNAFAFVQATADNTSIQIDDPQTSGIEVNVTKNKGETVYLGHIWAGTTVSATAPVQVQFLIGEDIIYTGQNNSRSYTAVPSGLWSTEYYSPVPGDLGGVGVAGWQGPYRTDLYIHNPTTSTLTINYEDVSGTGTFTVTASATEAYSDPGNANRPVPANSGVYLAAADGATKFWAIGAMAASDPTWNWGYTLLPVETLTDEYYVSWAPGGWDQTPAQPVDSSYSPIFVTPVEDNTIIFVDYSPADGAFDETYVLDRIQVQRVYDQAATGHPQDADNTGTHIWATGPIALAWGEDPDAAAAASPGLDAGYTILPMNKTWIDVVLDLEKTADPTIIADLSGQTSVFTLVIETDDYAVNSVVVTDTLPANWSYVSGSTTITLPDSTTISGASADPDSSGQDLIWDEFPSGPLDMAANQTLTIEFTAITTAAPGGASINNALTTGTYGGITLTADDFAVVDVSALEIEKISSAGGTVNPDDTITYTILITNTGTATQNNIVVSDTLPAGTTYVANSTVVTGYQLVNSTYADNFDPAPASYSGNDGSNPPTTNFSGSWIEDDGTQSPTAGDVQIVTDLGDLSLRPGTNTSGWGVADGWVYRVAGDLSACTTVALSYNSRRVNMEAADHVYLDMSANGGSSWTPNVRDITNGNDASYQSSGSIDVSAYKANLALRFRGTYNDTGYWDTESAYIDDVLVTCSILSAATRDNASGGYPDLVDGTPPDLVEAGDGFALGADDVMMVTFRVTVDDPVPVGQTSVVNTVAVSSVEEPTPLEDTVVDVLPLATIGNYVWLDEDGDGDQDAGEVGIPNVVVELYNADDTLVMTTTTDADGGYLFDGVVIGTYTVVVKTSTMPAGLAANPTYDEDDGTINPDSETSVTLTTDGEEHMTADFGYNWASPTETNNPGVGATGAIGDRVWIDADGDGAQDPGEPGLGSVMVRLYTDPDGDGVYDNLAGTATTNAAGNYIFDDLSAGAYVVVVNGGSAPTGYTQTGDPDYFGATLPAGERDNATTTPIVLAPGDVFVNADFGYQPTTSYTIGDTIWLDADADGMQDSGEPGIPGVTVALLDGDGNVIATTVTTASGGYLFTGLSNGDYTVWVNDTNNVLDGLNLVSEPSGGNGDGTSDLALSGGSDLTQDFGYALPEHVNGEGLIGDTIFLDRDGGNDYDPGEGLEGVVVRLYQDTNGDGNYDAGEPLLASTTTNENGNYYFGDLPAGDYVVWVDTTTLPTGVTNTVDPDSGTVNESGVTLTAGEIDLAQDFGYRDTSSPNIISGTIWEDTDADGALEVGESARFAGVTVVLYDSDGNVVAATETDSSGNYSFSNLPDGTYTVDVTDDDNMLNGYWHSDGTDDGDDNNSQDDPYTVSVSGGQTNATADFGYYVDPAGLGDWVWLDVDGDGIQGAADEPGIEGVKVSLTITYPGGAGSVTLVTYTDENGYYSFGNLLLDEDYSGDGVGSEPSYTISFADYGLTPSPTGQGTPDTDSNGASTSAAPVQGQTDNSYDGGFTGDLDLGDLPDTSVSALDYPTRYRPGPAHVVFPDGGDNIPNTLNGVPAVWLGFAVDTEPDGQPSVPATGDDLPNNDEDGVLFVSQDWVPGESTTFTITLNSSESSVTVYYGLWIDWNADGDFGDADDGFYSGSGVTWSPVDEIVAVGVPASYSSGGTVYLRARASDAPLSFDDYQGTIVNGEVEDYYDGPPTAVTLAAFSAEWDGGVVLVAWETALEIDTVGFNVWRSTSAGGGYVQINEVLIPAESLGGVMGGFYEVVDTGVTPSTVYTYKLEELEVGGRRNWYGPVSTGGDDPTRVTFFNVAASSGVVGVWWGVGASALVSLPLVVLVCLRKRRR
ncbi:MAG: carboxypeptidase regulatory-like domain-containing protein [Anaerolineae bacterium]|nr:carboxypeptidase regulatory-like domain-containing protein [Anaerolineae bacterium]